MINFRLFQTQTSFNFDENERQFFKQVENTVGKGEIARYKQFLLFPQCFVKTCTADTWKPRLVWDRVKQSTINANDYQLQKRNTFWLIEWCFYAVFNSFSVMTRRQLTLFMFFPGVSPVLGWGSEAYCPKTLQSKTPEDPVGSNPGPLITSQKLHHGVMQDPITHFGGSVNIVFSHKHFLLFTQCCPKFSFSVSSKVGILIWYRL